MDSTTTVVKGIEPATVDLRRLLKRFGKDVVAVNDVDLFIERGELLTLLGPSGCGKTTILRLIAGLERPTAGQILIDDDDVSRLPAYLRDITMVFQSYALFPHMNVFENVAYGVRVAKRPKEEIRERVHEALAMVGLEDYAKRATNALSGGQQQRVALARALVIRPRVLLFDEPLSNLDAKLRKRVREDIRSLQQRLGITSVHVTHDQEEALAISDRVVVMNQGVIEQIGSPHVLYTRPAFRGRLHRLGQLRARTLRRPLDRRVRLPAPAFAGHRERPRHGHGAPRGDRVRSRGRRGRRGDVPEQRLPGARHGVHLRHRRGRGVRDDLRSRHVERQARRHGPPALQRSGRVAAAA